MVVCNDRRATWNIHPNALTSAISFIATHIKVLPPSRLRRVVWPINTCGSGATLRVVIITNEAASVIAGHKVARANMCETDIIEHSSSVFLCVNCSY